MSEFGLSKAELAALVSYAKELRDNPGLRPKPGARVQVEGRLLDGSIRGLVGRPAQTVTLVMQRNQRIEGYCSCPDAPNCIHCLVFAEHLAPAAETRVPSYNQSAASIEQRVEAVLKRPLSRDEKHYLCLLAIQFQGCRSSGRSTVGDVLLLAVDPPLQRRYELWRQPLSLPDEPMDAIEFWHAARRALAQMKLKTPEFMDAVAVQIPPPPAWIAAWRNENVELWKVRFRNSRATLESARSSAKAVEVPRRLRCTVSREGLLVEWALPGTEEWAVFKRTPFVKNFGDGDKEAVPIAPESELLAEIIRRYGDVGQRRHASRDEYFDSGAVLLAILERPSLHAFLYTSKGSPYRFEYRSLVWHVIEPVSLTGDYELEVRMPDGEPVPSGSRMAQYGDSRVGFLLTDDAVWRMPPIPDALASASSNRVPREALADETALRLMVELGARLPESLDSLIERIPARLTYRFEDSMSPRLDSGAAGGEFARFTAELHDAEGKPVMKWSEGQWQPTQGTPSKSGRIRIIDSDQLPDPTTLGAEIGAKPEGNLLTARLTRNFPDKFAAWAKSLPEGTRLDLPRLLQSILDDPVTATVSVTCEQAGVDWFDLSVEITPDNSELSPEELRLLLAAKGGYVRMGTRGWMRARFNLSEEDANQLSALGLDPAEASAEPQRLHTLHLASAASRKLLPPEHGERVLRRQSELKTSVQPAVPADLHASLRPYQVEGFHFLAYLVENGFGGVLADDMGLGKTVQTLAWIAWLRRRAVDPGPGGVVPKRVLIVCPKSVSPNWKAEAKRFLPGLRIGVWAGQPETEFSEVLGKTDALVLNYAQLRVLEEHLARQEWLAVILDEAQAIKNPDSQTAKVTRSLNARHRVALTGTPIENRLLDLWSIFAFAMPGVLGTRAKFQRGFGKMGDAVARQRLATRVRPFLLRRTKGQVAQDLPPRIEEDVICELEGVQRDLYRAEYKKARAMLLGAATSEKFNDLKFHFLSSLTRLRQICCHPALVDAAQRTQPAAKVEALVDLLEPLIEEGHKVLVFSQFASMLELLQEEVRQRNWTEFFLSGQTENRGPLVEAFNGHTGAAVFLISLKAGGFGLNLTSASYVVLFDPWWNPAVEAQAIDRTHRIGQTQTVIAYRLIVKGSIEEKIRELQKAKSMMAGDTLGEDRFNQALTLDDFRFLFDSAEAAL